MDASTWSSARHHSAGRVTHIAIYASTPVQRIIGIFRVADCEQASPERLWERHQTIGAISSADFNTYYADLETGVAIHIACCGGCNPSWWQVFAAHRDVEWPSVDGAKRVTANLFPARRPSPQSFEPAQPISISPVVS